VTALVIYFLVSWVLSGIFLALDFDGSISRDSTVIALFMPLLIPILLPIGIGVASVRMVQKIKSLL
jgi:hypothetical protein